MERLEIIRSDHPSAAAEAAIRRALIAFNDGYLGHRDARPIGLLVQVDRRVLGGLLAETARDQLHIDALWLAPELRGRGLGGKLVRSAEEEALRRGCAGAWLDTYSFAAKTFYERLGYRVFGELDGYANGHTRFFMSKRLDAAVRPLSPPNPSS